VAFRTGTLCADVVSGGDNMPSNRKKPHSAIPTVQSYDRKKKAKPVEPEVERGKEYKSPAAPPDSEGDSNARKGPGVPPSDYM
jgi:hypothetical protein